MRTIISSSPGLLWMPPFPRIPTLRVARKMRSCGEFMRTGSGRLSGTDDRTSPTARLMLLPAFAPADTTLQSWKEIALELNRGVRTVQRWERDLKMPVRRIGKGRRAPVFAFKSELHRWLRSSTGRRAARTRGTLRNIQRNGERRTKSKVGLLQALENAFAGERFKRGQEKCTECNSPMQFLEGQFWLYGTRKKWKVSLPFCPVCNADALNAYRHARQIQ